MRSSACAFARTPDVRLLRTNPRLRIIPPLVAPACVVLVREPCIYACTVSIARACTTTTTTTTATAAIRYRQEQEVEVKLHERIQEQQHLLRLEEQQFEEAKQTLAEIERKLEQGGNLSAEEMLKRLDVEVTELKVTLKTNMPQQFMSRKERLSQLQDEMMKAPKTQDDIRALETQCTDLEHEVEELAARNKEAAEEKENDKLGIYRTQVKMVTRKLTEAQFELEEHQAEANDLHTQINDKEAVLSELTGPKFMKRDDFRKYANELRTKTKE
jgi:intraflagellar transport protein 81